MPDPATLADFLFRTAWSVNGHEPNDSIDLGLDGSLASSDWVQISTDAGLKLSDSVSPTIPRMSVPDARAEFGDWPGEVPSLPPGVVNLP